MRNPERGLDLAVAQKDPIGSFFMSKVGLARRQPTSRRAFQLYHLARILSIGKLYKDSALELPKIVQK